MAKTKARPERRVNVDLGDLRKNLKMRCLELDITLAEGVRRALELWLRSKAA